MVFIVSDSVVSPLGFNTPRNFAALLRGQSGVRQLLRAAVQQMNLSARAYHRILKLSRTIADLAGAESIQAQHVAEALQYRQREVLF